MSMLRNNRQRSKSFMTLTRSRMSNKNCIKIQLCNMQSNLRLQQSMSSTPSKVHAAEDTTPTVFCSTPLGHQKPPQKANHLFDTGHRPHYTPKHAHNLQLAHVELATSSSFMSSISWLMGFFFSILTRSKGVWPCVFFLKPFAPASMRSFTNSPRPYPPA